MTLAHQHIVDRINRRRVLAPLWETAIIFACLFVGTGLATSIGYASADLGKQSQDVTQDSAILAGLLNGDKYVLDGKYIVRCRVSK